jgi:peptide/nickel transport system permease protein
MTTVALTGVALPAARWRVLRRLLHNRAAVASLIVLGVIVVLAILAPVLAPYDPNKQHLIARNQGPSATYWLGTDSLGRDTLSRLLFGARVTLVAAVEGSAIAFVLGIPLGLYAGYMGGALDNILSRIADALLCLPPLILAMAIVGILGPSLSNAMLALGIVFAPRFFRLARSSAQAIAKETYVEAQRALGSTTNRIALRNLLPNASGPLLVQVSFTFGFVITAEASLAFLGLGAQPPQAEWGGMVRDAFNNIRTAVFPLIPPSVMIVITILALFILGDALRDALGRQQRRGS